MSKQVDRLAAGRTAYEMEAAQGRDAACRRAAKLAGEASAVGNMAGSDFWKAVEMTLTLR